MKRDKFGIVCVAGTLFRCAPLAALLKLIIVCATGATLPLMVLAAAAFLDSAIAFTGGRGSPIALIARVALLAAGYALTQIGPVFTRLADAAIENGLRLTLAPELIKKQSRTQFAQLENPDTLDLIAHITQGAQGRFMKMFDDFLALIKLSIQLFGTLCIVAGVVWWMIPLFVLCAVPMALMSLKGGKAIYRMDLKSSALTRMLYYLSDLLAGRESASERTLFGYADAVNKRFSDTHLKRSNMVTHEIAIEEMCINACGLLLNGLLLAALFALMRPVKAGDMSVGLYIALIGALIALMRLISGAFMRLIGAASAHARFMRDYARFFALPEAEVGHDGPTPVFERLEIKNLRFRYTPDDDYVLKGVNLTIERGKAYSLIGRNGAGKSTLTKILLGLYRDFEGEVLINGAGIECFSTAQLCAMFSAVYQDFARYFVPLSDNITLGENAGDIDRVLEMAGLSEVVARLPEGKETPLGRVFDGGAELSGGEWQRVAIARALYRDAQVMILDEPTASLSPMMESRLYARFADLTRGKTSLLISHRLGSTKLSDVLFVLDDGIIRETGTHAALMATGGIYADMFLAQRSWYDERT